VGPLETAGVPSDVLLVDGDPDDGRLTQVAVRDRQAFTSRGPTDSALGKAGGGAYGTIESSVSPIALTNECSAFLSTAFLAAPFASMP
jgi:hypothetical protein